MMIRCRQKLARIVLAVCLPLAFVPMPAAADNVCSCDDLAQIQYRITEDRSVIDAYQRYAHNNDLGFNTAASYAAMQRFVQGEMSHPLTTLQSPLDAGEQAKTGFFDSKCQTLWPTPPIPTTPCLRKALDIHEAIHRRECEASFTKRTILLISKLNEEIEAYSTEIAFLESEKQRLLCNCDYYALKLEGHDTLDEAQGGDHQQQDWLLVDSSNQPTIKIPLQLSAGTVSAEAIGTLRMRITDTGEEVCSKDHPPSPGNSVTHLNMTQRYSVSGTLRKPFEPSLTISSEQAVGTTLCTNSSGSVGPLAAQQSPFPSSTVSLLLKRFDDPFVQDAPAMAGVTSEFKATLVVNDKWIGAKAANGRGSTIDAALKEIGLCDCSKGN